MEKIMGYKADLTFYLSAFAKTTNNDIIIHTQNATIAGTAIADVAENELAEIFMNAFAEFNAERNKGIPDEKLKVQAIFLENVTIQQYGSEFTTSAPFLIVFIDQILGLSFGQIN
ncbi:hypothetical protein [Enterococcus rivorum]|uniref:Uncharacterized protein n=1 Tax=Enterococcus rivorum TaxID=762845 RepID=A0A1E5KY21_9ENTE|nr:hypothetical protein [Enterococcus rivorum]MBP2099678.1 hypothetical protein [Enterococcus rivorum]OEH82704.1 hypothetical protein BCR26_12270 [Enterococcus rivorum]